MNAERDNVWVYGVVPSDAQLQELDRGRDGLPEVWIVESGDLAAIVGEAPENDEKATRNQALAHAHVLEAAILDAPVVPFRFGIMVPDDQDVGTDLLDPQHDQLAQLLSRVKGRLQMTLKVYYDEETVLREIVESEPEVGELREAMGQGPEEATR